MPPIPDDELISAYLDDELSREDRLRAEQLLLDRADLRRLFEELRGLRTGLRSLPKFSLGEEFSASVLKQAERSVLQGNESQRSELQGNDSHGATPAIAGDDASPVPAAPQVRPQTAQRQLAPAAPAVLADRSRALRPIIYVLTAVAAALALMVYEQGGFDQRNVAMQEAPQSSKDAAGSAKVSSGADDAAENSVSAKTEGLRAPRPLAKGEAGMSGVAAPAAATIAPAPAVAAPLTAAAPGSVLSDLTMSPGPSSPANSLAAPSPIGSSGGLFIVSNSAAGVAPSADKFPLAKGPFGKAGPLESVREGELLVASPAPVDMPEQLAQQDFQRSQSLAFNYRQLESQRPDRLVDAGRLQQLAAIDQLNDNGGARIANGGGNVAVDATRRKAAGYGNALQEPVASFYDNGLVIVRCDIAPEALDTAFTPTLRQQRIVDNSDTTWGQVASALGVGNNEAMNSDALKAESQRGSSGADVAGRSTADRVAGSDAEKERLGLRDATTSRNLAMRGGTGSSAGGSNGVGAGGGAGSGGGKFGGADLKRVPGESSAGAGAPAAGSMAQGTVAQAPTSQAGVSQADGVATKGGRAGEFAEERLRVADEDRDSGETYEYVYVVANREQLESTLQRLRAEPKLFFNVSVEAATPEVAATTRWREFNRAGELGDPKSQAPAGGPSIAATAAAAPASPGATQTIAPSTSPPAKPTPTSKPVPAMPLAATPASSAPPAPAGAAVPAATAITAVAAPGPNAAAVQAYAAPASAAPTVTTPTVTAPQAAPIPQTVFQRDPEQRYESPGYGDQRRNFALSRSQRFNDRQLDATRSNSFAVTNPVGEKSQLAADNAKTKAVEKSLEAAKKIDDAQAGRAIAPKETAPAGNVAATENKVATQAKQQLDLKNAAGAMPGATAKPGADNKPIDVYRPAGEAAGAAKDEAGGKLGESQGSGLGGGFVPAPPMLPGQRSVSQSSDAPEQVLGGIVGTQQPPPLVRQPMPALERNRIRGVTQDEQAPAPNSTPQVADLPADYQEALFIFRVVKPKAAGQPATGEADLRQEPRPTGK